MSSARVEASRFFERWAKPWNACSPRHFELTGVVHLGSSLIALAPQSLHRNDDADTSWQSLLLETQMAIDIASNALGRIELLVIPERLW